MRRRLIGSPTDQHAVNPWADLLGGQFENGVNYRHRSATVPSRFISGSLDERRALPGEYQSLPVLQAIRRAVCPKVNVRWRERSLAG